MVNKAGRPKIKDDLYLAAVWNLVSRQVYNNRLIRTMPLLFEAVDPEADKKLPSRDISKACREIFAKHGKIEIKLPHEFADGTGEIKHYITDPQTLRLDYQAADRLRHDVLNHRLLHDRTKILAQRLMEVERQVKSNEAGWQSIQDQNKRGRGRPKKL